MPGKGFPQPGGVGCVFLGCPQHDYLKSGIGVGVGGAGPC